MFVILLISLRGNGMHTFQIKKKKTYLYITHPKLFSIYKNNILILILKYSILVYLRFPIIFKHVYAMVNNL